MRTIPGYLRLTMKIELNKREIYLIWKSLYAELDHQKFLQGFGNDRKETIEELDKLQILFLTSHLKILRK